MTQHMADDGRTLLASGMVVSTTSGVSRKTGSPYCIVTLAVTDLGVVELYYPDPEDHPYKRIPHMTVIQLAGRVWVGQDRRTRVDWVPIED